MADMAYDAECIFCRIAAREIPAEILHESDTVVAFRDTNPQAPVHILLIPKEHIPSATDIESRHGGVLVDARAGGLASRGRRRHLRERVAPGDQRRSGCRPERVPPALSTCSAAV